MQVEAALELGLDDLFHIPVKFFAVSILALNPHPEFPGKEKPPFSDLMKTK